MQFPFEAFRARTSEAGEALTSFSRASLAGGPSAGDKPARDPKKFFLVVGLAALSWVATYVGMLELIEANMGELPLVHKAIIGFSVAMLMTMIVWLLDQMFQPIPAFTKFSYVLGYVFLTIISVGFGFGFYWKVLESRSEASRSAESAVTQVQTALHGASTRLEQLQATLVQLTSVSTSKAQLERDKGTSCPNSKPGDGPRRKMREEDAQRFSFASEFVAGRVGAVKTEMKSLDGDLAKIVSSDTSIVDAKSGTRNEFMRALGHKLDLTVTGFNAFRTDPQLKQIRADLAQRADKTTITGGKGESISCPDPQLQAALKGVVLAIDGLPELRKPEIAAVEGSEATIEAFRRLTATFYGLLAFKLPPSADELRDLQKKAVQSVEAPAAQRPAIVEQAGLSKRDYVPLAVALFVDLCLLLVSMGRPMNRLQGLLPKMREAEQGPVIEILSRFNEIHRDQQIRDNFELFRHVVFDMNGDYYVAVPLDAPPRLNPAERETLRMEAQLLANLFTSFEKERIFKRSLLPATGSIRKRLARQGSKFAEAEAFRVYKFRDGAWSDIILGAVMGAARRVEAEKIRTGDAATRRNRLDQTHWDELPGWDEQPEARDLRTRTTSRDASERREPEFSTAPRPAAVSSARATASPDTATRPSLRRDPSAGAGMRSSSFDDATTGRSTTPVSVDPTHLAKYGPYANVFQPEPFAYADQNALTHRTKTNDLAAAHAEVTVLAANSNNGPVTDAASNVVPLSTQRTGPPPLPPMTMSDMPNETVAITLQRETATFSVPVSEATVSDALLRAGFGPRLVAASAEKNIVPTSHDAEPLDVEVLPADKDQSLPQFLRIPAE